MDSIPKESKPKEGKVLMKSPKSRKKKTKDNITTALKTIVNKKKLGLKYPSAIVEKIISLKKQYNSLPKEKKTDEHFNILCKIGNELEKRFPKTSYQFYSCGAKAKNKEALYNQAKLFMIGNGCKKDIKKAFNIFKKLHTQKFSQASFMLGDIYNPDSKMNERMENCFLDGGIIKDIDMETALPYYKAAADSKSCKGEHCFTYASILSDEVTNRNLEEALEYYEKAVKLGKKKKKEFEKIMEKEQKEQKDQRMKFEDKFAIKSLLSISKIFEEIDFEKSKEYIFMTEDFGNSYLEIKKSLRDLDRRIRIFKNQSTNVFKPKLKLDILLEKVGELDKSIGYVDFDSDDEMNPENITLETKNDGNENYGTPKPTPYFDDRRKEVEEEIEENDPLNSEKISFEINN